MKLKELKDWINTLPDEFIDYEVVNGETGKVDDNYHFRIDKFVTTLLVDKERKEVVILSDSELSEDEIKELIQKEV